MDQAPSVTGSAVQVIPRTDSAHPDGQYSATAKAFHWVTAVLVFVALPFGFVIKHIKEDTALVFNAIHESTGLTILIVVLARIVWRRFNPPPPLPETLPAPIRLGAAAVHTALYAMLVIQPIMGFIATNAFGFPMQGETAYLGFIQIPAVIGEKPAVAEVFLTIHRIGAYTIIALLAAHIAGALYHHSVCRDGTLMRML